MFPLTGFTGSAVSRDVTNSKQECMFFINPRLCLQSESDAFENRLKGNMCMTVKNMSHLVLVLQMIWCLRNQKDDSLFSCGRN